MQTVVCLWQSQLQIPSTAYMYLQYTVHYTWPFFFLIQISGWKDNSAFIEVIHSDVVLDCLGQAGSNGLPQFENREKLLAELCHYFVIDKVRSALEQFKEGLANLNVL